MSSPTSCDGPLPWSTSLNTQYSIGNDIYFKQKFAEEYIKSCSTTRKTNTIAEPVILTMAEGYKCNQIFSFLRSIRETGSNAEVVIFRSDANDKPCGEFVDYCGKYSFVSTDGYPMVKQEVRRYILALQWLNENIHLRSPCTQVIISDFYDVTFQTDPFDIISSYGADLILVEESYENSRTVNDKSPLLTIGNEKTQATKRWVAEAGEHILGMDLTYRCLMPSLLEMPVINSGVLIGTMEGMLLSMYVFAYASNLMDLTAHFAAGQGILDFIYYTGLLTSVVDVLVLPPQIAPFVHRISYHPQLKNPNLKYHPNHNPFVNTLGMTYSIVHKTYEFSYNDYSTKCLSPLESIYLQENPTCARAFQLIREFETPQTMNFMVCFHLTLSNNKLTVSRYIFANDTESVHTYNHYLNMQNRFWSHVGDKLNLTIPLTIIFKADDNGTLTDASRQILRRNGYIFSAHTHLKPLNGNNTLENVILQPDFHIIDSNAFEELIHHIDNNQIKFQDKKPIVFWRGTSNGGCLDSPRARLCLKSNTIPWIDAKFSHIYEFCKSQLPQNVSGNPLSETQWHLYRGIIDIPGSVNAWGLFWRLASGSVVFHMEQPFTNAYLQKMIPWVHYIPLYNDLSNLKEVTELVTKDEALPILELIAANAKKLTLQFTWLNEIKRVAREVEDLVSKSPNLFLYTLISTEM